MVVVDDDQRFGLDALRRHTLLIIVLGSLVISLAMGLRHGFGLFLEPMSSAWAGDGRSSPSPWPCRT